MFIYLNVVCEYFYITAELSSYSRKGVAHKAQNVYRTFADSWLRAWPMKADGLDVSLNEVP